MAGEWTDDAGCGAVEGVLALMTTKDSHDWKRVGSITYWCRECGAVKEGHNSEPKLPRDDVAGARPAPACVCQCDDGLVQEWVSKARAVARQKGYVFEAASPAEWPQTPSADVTDLLRRLVATWRARADRKDQLSDARVIYEVCADDLSAALALKLERLYGSTR